MCYHIELQIGSLQLALQLFETSDELARICDVVLPPVVCEDIKSVLVTAGAGILPIAISIACIVTQCFKQISVDIHFGKQAREPHCFDNLSGYEIVAIRCKVGTYR